MNSTLLHCLFEFRIYEKCIAETNLREFAQAHLNSDGLPN